VSGGRLAAMHSRKQTGFKGEDKTERAQKIRQDRRNLGNAKLHSRSSKQAEESSENWTDPGGRNQERCGYMYVPIHGGETILQGQERAIDFRSSGGGGKANPWAEAGARQRTMLAGAGGGGAAAVVPRC